MLDLKHAPGIVLILDVLSFFVLPAAAGSISMKGKNMIKTMHSPRSIMLGLMAKDEYVSALYEHDSHRIKPSACLYLLGSLAVLLAVLPLIALALLLCT